MSLLIRVGLILYRTSFNFFVQRNRGTFSGMGTWSFQSSSQLSLESRKRQNFEKFLFAHLFLEWGCTE